MRALNDCSRPILMFSPCRLPPYSINTGIQWPYIWCSSHIWLRIIWTRFLTALSTKWSNHIGDDPRWNRCFGSWVNVFKKYTFILKVWGHRNINGGLLDITVVIIFILRLLERLKDKFVYQTAKKNFSSYSNVRSVLFNTLSLLMTFTTITVYEMRIAAALWQSYKHLTV